ncbi:DUF4406 domain-containing protein [Candidatus Woesearchaeota archaeon]|nr:DUF4406 domain-containing protein [Candidatus Woesearchaeota archaeon]
MGKLVYIAHQVSGNVERNVRHILEICRDVHMDNDDIIPFAPYLVALQYLDDHLVEERELGMLANREHFERRTMDEVWLCGPVISKGMEQEIKLALAYEIPIVCYNSALEPRLEELVKTLT